VNGRESARSGEWAQHFFQMLLVCTCIRYHPAHDVANTVHIIVSIPVIVPVCVCERRSWWVERQTTRTGAASSSLSSSYSSSVDWSSSPSSLSLQVHTCIHLDTPALIGLMSPRSTQPVDWSLRGGSPRPIAWLSLKKQNQRQQC